MRAFALTAVVLATGCGAEEPRDCVDDRCEMAGSKDELLASLEGYNDPVARFLRDTVADDGTLTGDYKLVLDGVGAELGCDAETEKHFVVLSNQAYAPKPIVTRCANDAVAASQFFAAMVADDTRIDPKRMHMAAWDADAGTYRRYATAETADGTIAINVAPEFCVGCHGGPEKLGTWVPMMNEMASPWSNWNAHPGFASQLFDEHVPSAFEADPTYRELVDARLDSAASFEPIVRAGMQRVTSARLKTRAAPADAAAALALVRPLFCDESINYVSEVHDSGELRTSALVDDAIRSLYRTAAVDGSWSWLADTRMQLPAPATGTSPVTLIAIRGETTLQVELGLVARGVLSPVDALRVRALDWQHPVGSAFRCGLYDAAAARLEAGGLEAAIAASQATTVEGLIPVMFDQVMTLGGKPLTPVTGDVIAIPDATAPDARAALDTGSWAGFEVTLAQLGDALEGYVAGFQVTSRDALSRERDRRACATAGDPTAPIFPATLECP